MCWRNFCNFPWWLENVKSKSKIALFFKWAPFWHWFPKKRTITFFWSKLSKLHKIDPILHVATTFSLKQGETKTSHGPIPHPLKQIEAANIIIFAQGHSPLCTRSISWITIQWVSSFLSWFASLNNKAFRNLFCNSQKSFHTSPGSSDSNNMGCQSLFKLSNGVYRKFYGLL